MKNITVKNFKGTEFSGLWNEKVYSSKINDRSDLVRIYLNGETVHITVEEHNKISESAASDMKEKAERESLNARISVKELAQKMTQKDRFEIAQSMIFDLVKELNPDTDEYDTLKKNLLNSLYRLNDYIK